MASRRAAIALVVALGAMVAMRCQGQGRGAASAPGGPSPTISAKSNVAPAPAAPAPAAPAAVPSPTISAKSNVPPAPAAPAAPPGRPSPTISAKSNRPVAPLPPLPRSLEGTQVDGAFTVGDDGHLIASARLRRRFDYFLTAEGEESLAIVRARIAALAADELAPEDAAAALALFDRYCAYRDAGAALVAADPPPADPVAAIDRLRHDLFGRDAPAFFGPD